MTTHLPRRRPLTTLLLLSLAAPACGAVGGLSSKLPGGLGKSPAAGKVATPPALAASADDPPEIKTIIQELDDMEAGAKGAPIIARFAAVSREIGARLFHADEVAVRTSPKLPALRARYLGIKKALAASAGGHAPELMGDGEPAATAPTGDAQRVTEEALAACEETTTHAGYGAESDKREMDKQYAVYEQKLARARKVDSAAPRFHAAAFAVCELKIANLRHANEDQYIEEKSLVATEKGCGQIQFSVRAVMMGGKPGIYERVAGGQSFAQKIDCGKIPSGSKFPKEFTPAVDEFLTREAPAGASKAPGVVRFDGKTSTETDKEDLHVYKYADLTYYDRQLPFMANPCGGKDPKLACEASGAKVARVLNEVQFYVTRADAHRKAGQGPACKHLLQAAYSLASSWRKEWDDDQRAHAAAKGVKYRSRKGDVLTETEIVSQIGTLGKDADDKALGGYCGSAG